jgi:hypothetical protein
MPAPAPSPVCTFSGISPTLFGTSPLPTFYAKSNNDASFYATGVFKSGSSECEFYQGKKKSVNTISPYIQWTNTKGKVTSTDCDALTPSPFVADSSIKYSEVECPLPWKSMDGIYTLLFSMDVDTGPTSIVGAEFAAYPAGPTVTVTVSETSTSSLQLPPTPAATTTISSAATTITSTQSVSPTPSSTVTVQPFATTETVWATLTPPSNSTETLYVHFLGGCFEVLEMVLRIMEPL